MSEDDIKLEGAKAPSGDDAVEFLKQSIEKFPNQVTLVCMGALTNIALLIQKHAHIVPLIPNIVFIGCGVTGYRPPDEEKIRPLDPFKLEIGELHSVSSCHNVRCDVGAATIVLQSPIPFSFIAFDVTRQLWFEGKYMDLLRSAENELSQEAKVVGALTRVWLEYR